MSNQQNETGLEIAVIGMAGRFPGARNIDQFWENLKNGVESISYYSDEELLKAGVEPDLLENLDYVKCGGGQLEDKGYFDASFFGYSPVEAEVMDPQVRVFHECAWHSLEHAGYNPYSYDGLIGLYAGTSFNLAWEELALFSGRTEMMGYFVTSLLIDRDYLCTRISYSLNLKGPSVVVKTACSTSLVAIHMACQGILNGECDMALAGGITITHLNRAGYPYQEDMIFSNDGHCRAFDARGKGTIIGDGAGIVCLKRLEDAVQDGDTIHAVIKGTAINNDGTEKAGFTAPSVYGQAEVIADALRVADVEPETITYVEMHGTGTSVGDPIEIEGIKMAFNTDKKGFCKIGSVKTNVGHLDSAAGAASLIKTVMALKHRIIPPSLFYESPNRQVDFEDSPFYVNNKLSEWKCDGHPLRAGVSSFGIGGTNAHAVLEEAPLCQDSIAKTNGNMYILPFSAKTRAALDCLSKNMAEFFSDNPEINLADAAYTLQLGRAAFPYRQMVVCSDAGGAGSSLSSPEPGKHPSYHTKDQKKFVVFMFPGQGAQYVDMGRQLYENEPVFREEMDRCFEILRPIMGFELKDVLYPLPPAPNDSASGGLDVNQTSITQPVIFAVEYALAKLLEHMGIKPHAMIGHSIGEYTAACLAGVFSLKDALGLVALRGKLMQRMPAGSMLGVELSPEKLEPLLTGTLSLAAVNGPTHCVVSGPDEDIEAFEQLLREQEYKCTRLHTSHAFHSAMMDPVLSEFKAAVSKLEILQPGIPYISNLTGNWIGADEVTDPEYFVNHLRNTVRFSVGVRVLQEKNNAVFIEAGPGQVLSKLVKQHAGEDAGHVIVNLIRHPREDVADDFFLLRKIGMLWLYGLDIDWAKFYEDEKRGRIPLPTYPFQWQRYWIEGEAGATAAKMKKTEAQVNKEDLADWFYLPSWERADIRRRRDEDQAEPGIWLLFTGKLEFTANLVDRLKKESQKVITVKTGPGFSRVSGNEFIINPKNEDDYNELFGKLKKSGKVPRKILHLWSVFENDETASLYDDIDQIQDLGLYSLLYTVKAMGKQSINGEMQMVVAANNMHEVTGDETILCPGKASLLGPVKIIPLEYPHIRCCCVDLIIPAPCSKQEEVFINYLLAEFTNDFSDIIIAYRGSHRWAQTFKPVRLEDANEASVKLKPQGVYLITGGFGGMGFTLAEFLAKTYSARLILLGRSPFPSRDEWQVWLDSHDEQDPVCIKIRKVFELEECGAEIMTASGSISDLEKMQSVITEAKKRFGGIDGILHTAGVIDDEGVMQKRTRETMQRILEPKVNGTIVLDRVLAGEKMDFIALFSSLGNIAYTTKFGESGYCAANEFLDAFAYYKNLDSGTFTLSINWTDWLDVGMSVRSIDREYGKEEEIDYRSLLKAAILPSEGVESFRRILDSGYPRVVIMPKDLLIEIEGIKQIVNKGSKLIEAIQDVEGVPAPVLYKRPELTTEYVAPQGETEQALSEIWQKFLGIEMIGSRDNYFELGGDSLKSVYIAARIHKELNVEIPVSEFFNRPTIKEFARLVGENSGENIYSSIKVVENKTYYPSSSGQRRLFILQQLEPQSTGYNITMVVRLKGELDIEKIDSVFARLIDRHESLRTSFMLIDGEVFQAVHEQVDFKIECRDSSKRKIGTGDSSNETLLNGFIQPYDLYRAPLMRVRLIKEREKEYAMLVDIHHISADGTSMDILIAEFAEIHEDRDLPLLKIRYKDYSEWQRSHAVRESLKRQEEFWLEVYKGEIPVLNLPTDYARPPEQSFEGDIVPFKLSREETGALIEIGREEGLTLFMVLLAIFNIFLSKLSGQDDIVVGTPVVGRNHTDLEQVIGMFVNTLAIRNYPSGENTFEEFLAELKTQTLKAFENQDYQFEDLVEKAAVERNMSRNPLFDVMFALQNRIMKTTLDAGGEKMAGLSLTIQPYEENISKFDLTLTAVEWEKELNFTFEYCTKLFKKSTIERFVQYFKSIVESVIQDHCQPVSGIEIMSAEERERVLYEFNGEEVLNPDDTTIHRMFEEQAAKTPDNIAVVGISSGEKPLSARERSKGSLQQISYRELNGKANRLAHRLRENGVEPDMIVGLMVERSIEMIVAILAVLKAGGAYFPIDVDYPEMRKSFMMKDCNVKLLLTDIDQGNLSGGMPDHIESFDLRDEGLYTGDDDNPVHLTQGSHNLYVLYTSGSTGKPKGIMLEHRNLVNLMAFLCKYDNIDSGRILQFATISFDVSFHEMFYALLSGGSLYLVDRETRSNVVELFSYIEKNGIKTLFLPMTFLRMLFSDDQFIALFPRCVKHIQTAGEQVVVSDKFRAFLQENHVYLHNHYGPAEAHVVTTLTMEPTGTIPALPSIGKPVLNSPIFILDKWMNITPLGVPGELFIGGAQVGRGYLNRPLLTSERFDSVGPPFCKKVGPKTFPQGPSGHLGAAHHLNSFPNQKFCSNFFKSLAPGRGNHVEGDKAGGMNIYKTGDLARWLVDGNIEFLGRIDHQIKVRGFRIELGEIEAALLTQEVVEEVVVVARGNKDEDKHLCAYIVVNSEFSSSLSIPALRMDLTRELPEYMLPEHFVLLEEIPLAPNGKVDRKALPAPEIKMEDTYIPPESELEKQLVEIWSAVLKVEKDKISMNSDFFQLGGHSLRAIILISHIHKELNVKILLAEVFKCRTIKELSHYISRLTETGNMYKKIEPVEKKEYYPLSSAQKRLYFIQQLDLGNTGYNLPLVLPLGRDVDRNNIEHCLNKLAARHESLRTSFINVKGLTYQKIHGQVELQIEYMESSEAEMQDNIKNFVRPFDLAQVPLIRSGLIRLPGGEHAWLVDMHHIVSDGTSQMVLAEDFRVFSTGEEPDSLPLQYKDFSHWQNDLFDSGGIESQVDYWLSIFPDSDDIPRLELCTDFKRPEIFTFTGAQYHFALDKEEADKFKAAGSGQGGTLYMNFLVALNILFYKYTGQTDIIIGTGIAGRNHSDLQDIIGMFINTLVMRNYPGPELTYESFLSEVSHNSINAFENQDVQFEDLIDRLDIERDPSRTPLFDISMIVQNFREAGREVFKDENTNPAEEIKPPGNKKPFANFRRPTSRFDMTFYVHESADGINVNIDYYTGIFKEETIARLTAHLKNVIRAVGENPALKLADIDIISAEERELLLYRFNDTDGEYPRDKTIRQLFEEQVRQTPDRIAAAVTPESENYESPVSSAPRQITYRSLNERSNRLARLLISKGMKPGMAAALMVEPSVEMIAGILAILKSGGCYLPIEPNQPKERSEYILKDSRALLLLTAAPFAEFISFNGSILCVDDDAIYRGRASNPENENRPGDLVYIIYTSGTTGKSKGVLIENKNLVNYAHWFKKKAGLTEQDRTVLTSSYSFDLGYTAVYPSILSGSQLHIIPKEYYMSPENLIDYLFRHRITYLKMTPSLFSTIIENRKFSSDNCRELRLVLLGGEEIKTQDVEKAHDIAPHIEIMNHYGPTEATIGCVARMIDFDRLEQYKIKPTIGKPIDNMRVVILDKGLKCTPVGVPGELSVFGESVGRGYANRPELTAEKFISLASGGQGGAFRENCPPAPPAKVFVEGHGTEFPSNGGVPRSGGVGLPPTSNFQLIYRTGDTARWLPDGNIEFLGRIDHQVKVRGFRIELGEIESRLLKHEAVKEAVVVVRKNEKNDKFLAGYFVEEENAAQRQALSVEVLRNYLSKDLPHYMVPSFLIPLEAIPLTPNGKVNRRALPAPDAELLQEYIAPQDDNEKIIAEVWQEILGVERVGVNYNFFEIGGTSMDIIRVTGRLKEVFERDIPVVTIFRYPTVSSLAAFLSREQYSLPSSPQDRVEEMNRGKKDRMRRLQQKRSIK